MEDSAAGDFFLLKGDFFLPTVAYMAYCDLGIFFSIIARSLPCKIKGLGVVVVLL